MENSTSNKIVESIRKLSGDYIYKMIDIFFR